MIRHIVFFTADGAEQAARVKKGLADLAAIPGSSVFEVAENLRVDLYDNRIDIVVYAEFPDIGALRAFKAHPAYERTTAAVRPLRLDRYAADIDAVDAP